MTNFLTSLRVSQPLEYWGTQRLNRYSKAELNTLQGYENKCSHDSVFASLAYPGHSFRGEWKMDWESLATGNYYIEHNTYNHSQSEYWFHTEPSVTVFTRAQIHTFLESGSPVTSYEGNTSGVLIPAYLAKQQGTPLWKALKEKHL